ncbi:MAG: bifunctional folylpolyglutamate synthase/dihydrofolate synthase [Brevinematales bacterium]
MHPFLSSLINYERGLLKYQMDHFDPGRVGRMLEEAGFSYAGKKIFHIAGTKGKGSTAIYLSRLLGSVYSRVGLYTSPHLFLVEERIRINGEMIDTEVLNDLIEKWVLLIKKYECSFFEALTFLAMVYFLERGCEAIVLETGMGGRLDATNFVCSPIACLLTPIGWDHTKFLGNTLEAIAEEKAGIIKKGVPVFSAWQEEGVKAVFMKKAQEQNTHIVFVKNHARLVSSSPEKWVYLFSGGDRWETVQWGEVFVGNFLLAQEAVRGVGIGIDETKAREAFWRPLPFRMWYHPPFLLDVAHNPESFLALFQALEKVEGPKDLYIGILAEKELAKLVPIIEAYRSLFDRVVCFDFSSPRPSGGKMLFSLLHGKAAYSADIPLIKETGKLSVFTGSFYWAEEFLRKHGIKREEFLKI